MRKLFLHLRRLFALVVVLLMLSLAYNLFSTDDIEISRPASAPAAIDADTPWYLTLVSSQYGLPQGYRLTLASIGDGQQVDRRIAAPLKDMLRAARDDGYAPQINAGFRSQVLQTQLFNDKIADFEACGYDSTTATTLASRWVSPPGTSEHELGLAVDIGTDDQALYNWLAENSWRYGFIQRYPPDKTDITGVSHEPWHYRYVGKDAAAAIHANNLTLEEYLVQKGLLPTATT
ncbi:MAG: M15 family metallopeptidase [Peptococcaceae bacterium]|nr:M15 family metallopeptidase [Peptococcaceae bacterium]